MIARDAVAADQLVYAYPYAVGPAVDVSCGSDEIVVLCPAWAVGGMLGPGRHQYQSPEPGKPLAIYFVLTGPVEVPFDMVTQFAVPGTAQQVIVRASGSVLVRVTDPGMLIAQFVGLPFDRVNDGLMASVSQSVERLLGKVLPRKIAIAGSPLAVTDRSMWGPLADELASYNPTMGAVFGISFVRFATLEIAQVGPDLRPIEVPAWGGGAMAHALAAASTHAAVPMPAPVAVTEPAPGWGNGHGHGHGHGHTGGYSQAHASDPALMPPPVAAPPVAAPPATASGMIGGKAEASGFIGGKAEAAGVIGGKAEPAGSVGGPVEAAGMIGGKVEASGMIGGKAEASGFISGKAEASGFIGGKAEPAGSAGAAPAAEPAPPASSSPSIAVAAEDTTAKGPPPDEPPPAAPSVYAAGTRVLVAMADGLLHAATVRQALDGYYELELPGAEVALWIHGNAVTAQP